MTLMALLSPRVQLRVFIAYRYTNICSAQADQEKMDLETLFGLVTSDGRVNWWTPIGRTSAHCPMDITWFPRDAQNCALIYESWALPSAKLNITQLSVDLSMYQPSGEWMLVGKDAPFLIVIIILLSLCAKRSRRLHIYAHCESKKQDTLLMSITPRHINQFSKIFTLILC